MKDPLPIAIDLILSTIQDTVGANGQPYSRPVLPEATGRYCWP